MALPNWGLPYPHGLPYHWPCGPLAMDYAMCDLCREFLVAYYCEYHEAGYHRLRMLCRFCLAPILVRCHNGFAFEIEIYYMSGIPEQQRFSWSQ